MLCHPVFFAGDEELTHACDQELHSRFKRRSSAACESASLPSVDEPDGAILTDIEPQQKRSISSDGEIAKPLFAVTYTNKSRFGKKLWARGKVINVFFIGSHPKRDQVLGIASEWSNHCSIRFREVSKRSESEVRVSFDENAGSFSLVGTDASRTSKDNRTMNLAVVDKSTVLHEFGHVLGLLHEHQSPIKGIVQWDVPKVLEKFRGPPNFWSDEDIRSQILDRYETDSVTGSEYDRWSIMHYSFSKDLILSIDGRPPLDRDIPVIKDLSPTDKAVVEWLYGPPGTKPEPPKEDPRRRNRPSHEESVDIGPDYTISPGAEIRFNFTSDKEEPRKYTIETVGREADLSLSLYGPDSEDRFISSATDGGEDGNPRVVQDLLAGRKYYIVIRAHAKGGAFDLKISTIITRFATVRQI